MANILDLLKILRSRRDLGETIRFQGVLRIRELPEEWNHADYLRYWCGERDTYNRIITPPIISEREKQRYTVVEAKNQLTTSGRSAILTYIGATGGSTTAWGKYLAIGTGSLQATSPVDTSLVNEVYRVLQSANTVQGSQIDINFQIPSASAQVTMTEAGIYGGSASGTLGSGTLETHVLFSYTKGAYSVSSDYLVTLI